MSAQKARLLAYSALTLIPIVFTTRVHRCYFSAFVLRIERRWTSRIEKVHARYIARDIWKQQQQLELRFAWRLKLRDQLNFSSSPIHHTSWQPISIYIVSESIDLWLLFLSFLSFLTPHSIILKTNNTWQSNYHFIWEETVL